MKILKEFKPGQEIEIPTCGSWPNSSYLLCKDSAYALEMALATGRPLLVKGEPGLGKSYLARAAAAELGRAFIAEVINVNTEGQDLLWRMDLVSRLNDAQLGSDFCAVNEDETQSESSDLQKESTNPKADKTIVKRGDALNPNNYLNPGVLWWAFNWQHASVQYEKCRHKVFKPKMADEEKADQGVVLLIDEIDKADPSLPNSLLEVLGNGGFTVPQTGDTIHTEDKAKQPLVIITTNDERELPPAFLRRCLVLHLKIDKDNTEEWLAQRARVHFDQDACSDEVLSKAAQQLIEDRQKALAVKPGLAEYLDLLSALDEMVDIKGEPERSNEQLSLLQNIQKFVLNKAN
ncbi:AAA family ATPase [Oceanospirillum beijerinckii]|uniref:AAA family ATPase n=1 Tax=Oceanospirillum beijerinckii TaxID=64976 RepID=UPI0004199773|nr:MoxR family ATPase [Oceanospirillum beijerinckii]